MQKLKFFFSTNMAAFSPERIFVRLLAAWCIFIGFGLIGDPEFDKLEYAQDTSLIYMFLFIVFLFIIFTFINVLIINYESDTWFLMLGSSVCVVLWLLSFRQTGSEFFISLAVAAVYSLFTVYFIRKNDLLWKKWNPSSKTVWGFAIAFGIFCGVIIGTITCYRHLRFSTPNFDFGLFVNMFHNMKECGLPLCTSERDVLMSHFVIHISPIYYLLLPFYMIFPSPLTLQIGQAVILASGVIPVILLCKQFKLSQKVTILTSFIYALYPALSIGCFYDLHENCFLTPLLLWVFYFFERNKWPWMYIFAALTLTVKEDAAIYLIIFAIYAVVAKKKYYHGVLIILGSIAYFTIALTILEKTSAYYAELYANSTPNPYINGPMINRFSNLILDQSKGLGGAVKTALLNPGYLLTQLFVTEDGDWGKILYFLKMFLPVGFIPFFTRKPSRWLLIAPILMNLLTMYVYQYNLKYQYHFGIIAFIFYATITNLPDLKFPVRRNIISVAAVFCLCMYLSSVIPVLNENHTDYNKNEEKYTQMEAILDTIPKDASVCCSTFLLSHLADRDEIYEIYYHDDVGDVDYVIFDTRGGIDNNQLTAFLNQGYEIKEEHPGMLTILERTDK
ncbi:MAG: DUF2079 domain-containing protein [Clostridia bacterium]|nr:DUF2079 domain-containing protein [Clostridia bacterium]